MGVRHKCKLCKGPLILLGILGRMRWYRCRNCGMEFSKEKRYWER